MELPLQLIVLSLPSLLYLAVRRRRGDGWPAIFTNLGWTSGKGRDYLAALSVFFVLAALGRLATAFIPADLLQANSPYAGWTLSAGALLAALLREAFHVALGEEILFRGLLGGWLMRKLGFARGNLLQALTFLLPHLFLLTWGTAVWPALAVQFIAGWLLGWLRWRSDSILPGWLVHTLVNLGSAAWFMS
jgi:uncharacterized protein